jgi:hypothetical protein
VKIGVAGHSGTLALTTGRDVTLRNARAQKQMLEQDAEHRRTTDRRKKCLRVEKEAKIDQYAPSPLFLFCCLPPPLGGVLRVDSTSESGRRSCAVRRSYLLQSCIIYMVRAGRRIIRSNEMIEAHATGVDDESFAPFVVAVLSQLPCGFIPEMND